MIPVLFDKPENILTADTRRQSADKKTLLLGQKPHAYQAEAGNGSRNNCFFSSVGLFMSEIGRVSDVKFLRSSASVKRAAQVGGSLIKSPRTQRLTELLPYKKRLTMFKINQTVKKSLFFQRLFHLDGWKMHRFVTQTKGSPMNHHQFAGI